MNSHFIDFGASRFHYKKYGNGSRLVFCFHGYGELAESFAVFEPLLGEDFTLYAIDAPFHGKTSWKGELLLKPADLMEIMNRIAGSADQQLILFGYSMGGRMAMKLFELMPQRIEKMVLVAPDGLHKNKWQWFTTKTILGNRLFKYTMQNPSWIFEMLQWAERFNWMNKSISKFVHFYLDDPRQRAELYKIWTTTRRFRPDLRKVKKGIEAHKVLVHLIFGKYDRIILAKRGHHFSKGLESLIRVKEIEAGHQLLQKKYANIIASLFIT